MPAGRFALQIACRTAAQALCVCFHAAKSESQRETIERNRWQRPEACDSMSVCAAVWQCPEAESWGTEGLAPTPMWGVARDISQIEVSPQGSPSPRTCGPEVVRPLGLSLPLDQIPDQPRGHPLETSGQRRRSCGPLGPIEEADQFNPPEKVRIRGQIYAGLQTCLRSCQIVSESR